MAVETCSDDYKFMPAPPLDLSLYQTSGAKSGIQASEIEPFLILHGNNRYLG
jgi:hypothetical protein